MLEFEDWLEKDEKLSELIESLKANSNDEQIVARELFYKASDLYGLPKKFEDLTDEVYEECEKLDKEAHCVFEELAILNYLDQESGIIDKVLYAIYLVSVGLHLDTMHAAIKHFGSESSIVKPYFIYFFGNDIDAIISLSIPSHFKSWTDAGAIAMWQIGT